MKEKCAYLSDQSIDSTTAWFDDFETWQRQAYSERILTAIQDLESIVKVERLRGKCRTCFEL